MHIWGNISPVYNKSAIAFKRCQSIFYFSAPFSWLSMFQCIGKLKKLLKQWKWVENFILEQPLFFLANYWPYRFGNIHRPSLSLIKLSWLEPITFVHSVTPNAKWGGRIMSSQEAKLNPIATQRWGEAVT